MDTAATPIVLITGTSSGIGLAAAVAAARAGYGVVATMRDTGRAGALHRAATEAGVDGRIEVEQLDVTDPESVAACLDTVLARHGGSTPWSTTRAPDSWAPSSRMGWRRCGPPWR